MLECHPERSEGSPWISSANALIAKYKLLLKFAIRRTKRRLPVMVNYLFPEEITAPLFSTEWGKRASWATLGLFTLLFGVTVIQTVITWRDDYLLSQAAVRANTSSSADNATQLITHLPDEHLFGKLGVTDGGALPITSLQLRLLGIVKSTNENNSRVIISEAGQTGKVYSIGDSLPSGITVNAITDDGVVLENGGHMEKLPLRRTQLAFQGIMQRSPEI